MTLYYTVMLLTDQGWCQGSDIVTNSQQIFNIVYGAFQMIEDDKGRVLVGTTYRNIQKALQLQADGGVSPSMSFGQVRNREIMSTHMIKSIEAEYDMSDNDTPYVYTTASSVTEMLKWLELRNKVLARRPGGFDDDDTQKVGVVA